MTAPRPFKRLTPSNWSEPDPVSVQFGQRSAVLGGGVRQMDGHAWSHKFLAIEIKQHVPSEVRDLFDVARGALLYGWYFYPLYRLGEEQLHRVLEAAAMARCRQLGGLRSRVTFKAAVDWLIEHDAIHADDEGRWQAARELRNRGSHPTQQPVMTPGAVLTTLTVTAHDINRIFTRGRSAG